VDLISIVRSILKTGGEAGVKAGELALEAEFPWLKLPIISWLWRNIFEKYASAFIKALMDKSTEILVPVINEMRASAADEASKRLQKKLDEANLTAAQLEAEIILWEEKYEALIRMRRSTPD
jgi:hypothetical protein